MKFLTLVVVMAALALNVSAYSASSSSNVSYPKASEFVAVFKNFLELVKQYLPHFFVNFMEKILESLQKIAELVPAEVVSSFNNFYQHFPTVEQFFPTEFFVAAGQFIRSFQYFFPAQFITNFTNFVESFPKMNEFVTPEVWSAVGAHVENTPFVREFFKNTYLAFKQLYPYVAHN